MLNQRHLAKLSKRLGNAAAASLSEVLSTALAKPGSGNAGLVHPVPVVYADYMQHLFYIILFGVLTMGAQAADIYRSKDSEGNVVYSDTAEPGSEKVTVEEPTVVPSLLPPSGQAQSNNEKPGAVEYKSLAITQPADEQTIRENVANVSVTLSAEPHLQSGFGHKLQLLFDGQGVGEPGRKLSFTLESVDRGAHTLQAVITAPDGRVVMRSPITTFFVHKQSVRKAAP